MKTKFFRFTFVSFKIDLPLKCRLLIKTIHLYFILLRFEDVKSNLRPLPNILINHPPDHKNRALTYFIPKTIKFGLEYHHLAKKVAKNLINIHPLHPQKSTYHAHLYSFIQLHHMHPNPRLLYTLIVILNPSFETCEQSLRQEQIPPWIQLLLDRLVQLSKPPKTTMQVSHPIDIFFNTCKDIIHPSTTIHNKLNDFIYNHTNTLDI
jgi:hypothetical protein